MRFSLASAVMRLEIGPPVSASVSANGPSRPARHSAM